jgi:hypothetical protein
VNLTASALLLGESRAHHVSSIERSLFSSSIDENAHGARRTTDRSGARTSHGIDSWRTLVGLPEMRSSLPFLDDVSLPVDKSVTNAEERAVDGSWTIRRIDLSTPLLHTAHQIPTTSDPRGEVHKGVTSTGLTD